MEYLISKHQFLNLVTPPLVFIFLCIIYPFYLVFKLSESIFRTFSPENIAEKVVLITGASSGIGEQLVYEYAKRGAYLVVVARRENRLRQVAEKALSLGSPGVLVSCADVAKVEDCKRFIQETINHFGRLDHLVNNAGITSVCPFDEVNNILNCAPMMDVNFWGSIYPTHFAIPHLKKTKGKIVVIASPSGWLIAPRLSFYGASKAAVISFYESLRVELDKEITIMIASPGVTESEMTRGKHLGKSGAMEVDELMMGGFIGNFPVLDVETCAKTIANGICRGETYLTEPSYYGVFYLMKVVCPEMAHLMFRWIHLMKPPLHNKPAPSLQNNSTYDRSPSILHRDDHHHHHRS